MIATTSSAPAKVANAPRVPLVEHRLSLWEMQTYVHDVDVVFGKHRFRIFFRRHRHLPVHPTLGFHGELVIMRVGTGCVRNVVNLRSDDRGRVKRIAVL